MILCSQAYFVQKTECLTWNEYGTFDKLIVITEVWNINFNTKRLLTVRQQEENLGTMVTEYIANL